jgi:hypothetical protein
MFEIKYCTNPLLGINNNSPVYRIKLSKDYYYNLTKYDKNNFFDENFNYFSVYILNNKKQTIDFFNNYIKSNLNSIYTTFKNIILPTYLTEKITPELINNIKNNHIGFFWDIDIVGDKLKFSYGDLEIII